MRWMPAIILIALAIVIVLARLQTYDEPLENDVAGYAVFGREMLHGRKLYSDLWERKPPLLFVTYETAEFFLGPGRRAVFAINITAALLGLITIYAAATIVLGVNAGLFAASLWTLLGGDLYLQANQPNTEALVNPCLTAGVALLLLQLKRPDYDRWWSAFAVGLLFTAATFFKHHLIAFIGVMLAAYVISGDRPLLFRRVRHAAIASVLIGCGWIGLLAYIAATHRLHVFVDSLAVQVFSYVGNPSTNLLGSLKPSAIATVALGWVVAPLLLLLGALSLGDRTFRPRRIVVMWLAWVFATWLAEALPGRLFPHYFQYWLPVWCVTGGVAAGAIVGSTRAIPSALRYGVILLAFGFALLRQGQVLRLSPDQWADVKYPGGNYTQQKYLGRYLTEKLLRPGETFWVGGDDVSLYFESGISPLTGLIYTDPMVQGKGPRVEYYNRKLVSDLSVHPPDLVLLTPLIQQFPPDAPIFQWVRDNYDLWGTPVGGRVYHLYVRRGSALARRVATGAPLGVGL